MKKILFILLLALGSCKKSDIPTPQPPQEVDVFSVAESTVADNSNISFKLDKAGIYIIKLVDKNTEQVIAKERINGKVGMNTIKIYTRTLPVKYLYLVLENQSMAEIGRTTIKIN